MGVHREMAKCMYVGHGGVGSTSYRVHTHKSNFFVLIRLKSADSQTLQVKETREYD